MRSHTLVFAVLCALVLGFTAPTFAQDSNAAPAAAPTTGKFVFTFTITVASVVPTNGVVTCGAAATVSEAGQNIQQTGSGIATISAGKGTCKVIMPYSWQLATPASDTVSLSYHVDLDYGYQVTATNGAATLVVPAVVNSTRENDGTIAVPLNGATTNEAITARI
jgi:hypothetical protein